MTYSSLIGKSEHKRAHYLNKYYYLNNKSGNISHKSLDSNGLLRPRRVGAYNELN